MTRPALLLPLLCLSLVVRAEVTPGEILIGEMNCAACHDAGATKARLASRESPRLGADGVNVTPQWLRGFLADPQKEKPGTLMPDVLHALSVEQKTEAVEALTHFLVGIRREGGGKAVGTSVTALAEGERLYHSLGCVQCHAPTRLPEGKENDAAAKEEFAKLQASAVPLGTNIASKYTVAELTRFLRDPLKARPSGRMPAMNLTEGEAQAVATYLLREQLPAGKMAATAGLQFDYYQKDFPELPEFDRLKPDASGSTDVPTLKVAKRKNSYATRFTGNVQIAKTGKYKFYTESDDGSRLYIDGKLVVENGGIHPAQERSGELDLKAGAHAFVLTYFDGGGETSMRVLWKGPDMEKQPMPAGVFSHDSQPLVPLGDAPFTVDAARAERGKALFAEYNCAACHAGTDVAPRPAKVLAQLVARQPRGCLASKPAATTPKFEINDRQRQVVLALLQEQAPLNTPLNDEEQIRRTLTVMNCYACHQRDRRGGADGLRRDYFASIGEVDLGEEGRIPPALTGVGAKLQPAWMKEVLEKGEKVRPYMATRMPQFGARNLAHLPALFDRADTAADAQSQPNVFAPGAASDANKFGRKLIGVGGLTCVACHNFAGNKSLGIPAVDLASTGQRLKWDWFRRYLLDPQTLRPGTRMPSFFPGGVAANKDLLGGDTEKQIASIWAYFARKNFTDLPAGLIQGKLEIVAADEAVMYRNFIDGGGPRAIGVGYPEKANLCFDANEMRLSMIWQGPFIDASKHRSGRGAGFEKPLGTNIIKGPPGPPFAALASESDKWPAKGEGYRFRGYRLDEKRRPAFRYTVAGVDVEDFPIAIPGEVDATIQRTLTFSAKEAAPGTLYFRAAVGPKIDEKDGVFTVGENLRLKFSGAAKPLIRDADGKQELLVPITFKDGKAVITESISW
jgi:mono/diheme cytochrome c family protein